MRAPDDECNRWCPPGGACRYIKVLTDTVARSNTPDVVLVGGFLRDWCLNHPSRDMDFAVSEQTRRVSRRFARRLGASWVVLDEEHECYRVVLPQEGWTFDFARLRGRTLKEDLRHRDFTVNVCHIPLREAAGHLRKRAVRFPLGGRRDLREKKVRMIGPWIFDEDPLRLLRAFSLSASRGFRIEPHTKRTIALKADLIKQAAAERIREELFKILDSGRAARTLGEMERCGLMTVLLPESVPMKRIGQGGYHHLDVWRHSLETVRQLERLLSQKTILGDQRDEALRAYWEERMPDGHRRRALLILGALLHDIGKPATYRNVKGRVSFHGHEHLGAQMAADVARRWRLSTRQRRVVQDLVRLHLRPGYLSHQTPTRRAVYRFVREAGPNAAGVVLLAWADQRATRGPLTTEERLARHERICRQLLEHIFAPPAQDRPVRLLNGRDVMRCLGIGPGPAVGRALAMIEEAAALGEIRMKEEAVEFLKNRRAEIVQGIGKGASPVPARPRREDQRKDN